MRGTPIAESMKPRGVTMPARSDDCESPQRLLEQRMLEAVIELRGYAGSVTILCTLPETAPLQYLMAGDRDGVRRVWNALAAAPARATEPQP
jgi:hypothetical protein